MKIGMISDIHVDINEEYPIKEALSEAVKEKELDYLLIAGDISNNCKSTIETVEYLQKNCGGTKIYYVPGNHDIWDEKKEFDNTNIIYEKFLQHPSCLCGGAKNIGEDYVVIGDIGWYDYSFGDSSYSEEEFERMSNFERTMQDKLNVKWLKSDKVMHKYFMEKLERQIRENEGKKKIVMTHMLSHRAFTVPSEIEKWRYFNAFMGSVEYGEIFEKYGVEYVLMGHIHYRKTIEQSGTKYICSCLNYSKEWQGEKDYKKEISKSIFELIL